MQLTNKVYRDGQRIGSGVTKKKSTFRFPPSPCPPKKNALSLVKEITTSCTVDTLVF